MESRIPENFLKEFQITDREREVLERLLIGESNREIGDSLNISANTVKRHVYNLFQKTGVNNRVRMINAVQEFRE